MTPSERLSKANGTYVFLAAVVGAHPDDLEDRLREVISGEFDGQPVEGRVTHVLVYAATRGTSTA